MQKHHADVLQMPAIKKGQDTVDILRVEHLSFVVEGRRILNDLSLSIEQGIVHSILGPNAAGKSTLAAVLMGCCDYPPSSGNVFFMGKDITHLPIHERALSRLK